MNTTNSLHDWMAECQASIDIGVSAANESSPPDVLKLAEALTAALRAAAANLVEKDAEIARLKESICAIARHLVDAEGRADAANSSLADKTKALYEEQSRHFEARQARLEAERFVRKSGVHGSISATEKKQ